MDISSRPVMYFQLLESINDICTALINIKDMVCCSLDIGGCIATETLCILCVVS